MMSEQASLFADTIELLLQGACICQYSAETSYYYLVDNAKYQDVESYLKRINRQLCKTQDNIAYFAAYNTEHANNYNSHIRAQFNEAINDLEPLVRWLNLCRCADKNERPLLAGDIVKESQLLAAIEDAPLLGDELSKLSQSTLLKNTQSSAKGQLSAILRKLCDHGYLLEHAKASTLYTATGRWSRLYDLMSFIASHEHLDEDSPKQQEFAL